MSAAPIYVAVASYGAPSAYKKPTGERYGPIVMETEVEGATLESAQARAAYLERQDYGACRVARLVFEGEPGFEVPAHG